MSTRARDVGFGRDSASALGPRIFQVKASDQHPARIAFGRIEDPESPSPLHVKTGLDDDLRRPLGRRHRLYKLALYAWLRQDRWPDDEHREFWTAFTGVWPRQRGQRQLKDTIGWWALSLRRAGLSDTGVAEALGYPLDTLRKYGAFDRGDMVWHEQIERPAQSAARIGPSKPLPRVYGPHEDEPDHSWVNLPLTAQGRPKAVVEIERRAVAKLAALREGDQGR